MKKMEIKSSVVMKKMIYQMKTKKKDFLKYIWNNFNRNKI